MNFFKGIGQKGQGGDKKSSNLFAKMKIKGPVKQDKPKPAKNQVEQKQEIAIQPKKQQEQIKLQIQQQDIPDTYILHQENSQSEKQQSRSTNQQFKSIQQIRPLSQQQKVISSNDDKVHDSIKIKEQENNNKKYSASQASFNFQKKRDRKASNPFMNQIKKNPGKEIAIPDDEASSKTQVKVAASPVKRPIKSEKDQLIEELNNGHFKIMQFILKQKSVKQAIIQISGSLGQFKEQLVLTTQKQCEAIQQQEYEQAEKYQNKIDTLQAKVEEQQIQLSCQQQNFYKYQYEELGSLKQQGVEHKKMVRKIKLVEMQLTEESSNVKRSMAEYSQNQKVKIENEKKKIIRLDNDIKFQTEQLSSYQKQFNQDLNSRRDPLLSELEQSNTKKIKLEKQVQELQALLKKKKLELKEVSEGLKEIKKQINQVQQNFREQGIKLNERKTKIKKLQEQKNDLAFKLQEIEDTMTNKIQKMQEESQGLYRQAKSLELLSKKIETQSLNFEDKLQERKVKIDNFVHSTKSLKQFQEEHKSTKQKLKQLEFKKANAVAEANKLEQRRVSLKNSIPKLESEQKLMAQAKNFKGAGMKKNQIKQASQEMELIGKKIQASFIQEKQIEEEVNKIEQDQEKYIQQQNQIRKNLAISQFKFNIDKYSQIKTQLTWLNSVDCTNKSINKEKKENYQNILKEELDNLEEQLKYIGEEYELEVDLQALKQAEPQKPKTQTPKPIQKIDKKQEKKSKPVKQQQKVQQVQENTEPVEQQQQQQEKEKVEQKKNTDEQKAEKGSDTDVIDQIPASVNQDSEQKSQSKQSDDNDGGYVPLQFD